MSAMDGSSFFSDARQTQNYLHLAIMDRAIAAIAAIATIVFWLLQSATSKLSLKQHIEESRFVSCASDPPFNAHTTEVEAIN